MKNNINYIYIPFKKLNNFYKLPEYAHSKGEDVGIDFYSPEYYCLKPLERVLISTGIAVAIPKGYELQIRSRSGLALKKGLIVLNTPGTIDPGYRGEIKIIIINLSNSVSTIQKGERIAQGILSPVNYIQWEEVEELPVSQRSSGGFGSTG